MHLVPRPPSPEIGLPDSQGTTATLHPGALWEKPEGLILQPIPRLHLTCAIPALFPVEKMQSVAAERGDANLASGADS